MHVLQAAIKDLKGKVWTLPRPARHNDIIHKMYQEAGTTVSASNVQGFVLVDGAFVDRVEAAAIVMDNGDIEQLKWPPLLYSADTPEYKALSANDRMVIDLLAEQSIPFVDAELVQWEDENGITICVEEMK